MQETHPLTWVYLKKFEKLLRGRAAFKKFFDPQKDPFYSMYDISEYTFSPFKVVWMDVSSTMKAVVIAEREDHELPIPEHKLMLLTAKSEDEAPLHWGFYSTVFVSDIAGNFSGWADSPLTSSSLKCSTCSAHTAWR
jgi:hypothetical protein